MREKFTKICKICRGRGGAASKVYCGEMGLDYDKIPHMGDVVSWPKAREVKIEDLLIDSINDIELCFKEDLEKSLEDIFLVWHIAKTKTSTYQNFGSLMVYA